MSKRKIAIITGGSRGIGAAVASELAIAGMDVVVNYSKRREDAVGTVAALEKLGARAIAVQADAGSPADLDKLFAVARQEFGRLDVLINNAGVGATRPLEAIDSAFIDAVFSTNVKSALLASQRAVNEFGPEGGVIVNLSSVLATQPAPAHVVYAASKAAIEAATRVLAQELAKRKIRVNAVAPGPVDTELLGLTDDFRAVINSKTALGRVAVPADIAKVVAFLVSDAAAWITGEVVGVSGGLRI
jgi:3-oxoacyl-[acyl-carrier protein] reductase